MKQPNPKRILWILIGIPAILSAQSPGGVSANLSLWVRADAGLTVTGSTVTKWADQTGINNFTKSGSGITTVSNVVNFHPVVRFTGNGTLQGTASINWSECTAVAGWSGSVNSERGTVISPTISGTAPNDASRYFFRAGVEATPFLYAGMGVDSIGFEYITAPGAPATAATSPTENIYTASGVGNVFNQNGMDARVGSLYGGFTQRATVMSSPPQIGDRSTDDSKMNGDIAEIIVYSSNNAANRNKVESYLALKYGVTLGNAGNPVNYTSSANTVFWTGKAGYQHNIFGIGSDQASGLVQNLSNSMNSGTGNGSGQSAKGNLLLSTSINLTNQQFLMIGTDSASLGEETVTTANGPIIAAGSKRVIRTWKVQNTNSVGAVTLSFNMSGLTLSGGTTASNYWLMIDNDGDGNFTTGTQSFVRATSLSAPLISFSSITLNNNVVFTIITTPSSFATLGIGLESFTAVANQNMADLSWTLSGGPAAGMGIDHYAVERSSDAITFFTAGIVAATSYAVSGADAVYDFREQLTPGPWYYRIRIIDQDGSYQFSPVRSLYITGAPILLRIASNPVQNNQLRLLIEGPPMSGASQTNAALIRIADRLGNILLQRQQILQPGSNALDFDLSALATGLYYVQMETGDKKQALPFLK